MAGAIALTHPPIFTAQFRSDLQTLFTWRRDVRRFRNDPLPAGTLERLVTMGCSAPSVGLSEPWRFVIVDDPERRAAIAACFADCNADALQRQSNSRTAAYARLKLEGLGEAPGHIAVFADRTTTQGHDLGRLTMPVTIEYSAVMAVHTMWLAARADGIGLGWVSILDPLRVASILDVPAHWTFIAYLCVGYPSEESNIPTLEREGWEARRLPASVILKR
jgi:5,6-dimethylbenzimidazole synthase